MEKLWTTSEVAAFLGIEETEVERLVQDGKLTGYKLGGQFLRFRPDQVESLDMSLREISQSGKSAQPSEARIKTQSRPPLGNGLPGLPLVSARAGGIPR